MIKRVMPLLMLGLGLGLVAGCSSKDEELAQFIAQTKQEQPSGVEPLPEIKPYETFAYADQSLRSPFVPGGSGGSSSASIRPDSKRNKEFLEAFALDTLKMVGTMKFGGKNYGLVRATDGLVYRVLPGNYLGQNEGRITSITPSKINITEIIPDGLGGFVERSTGLALDE
jgi:type IV pilus assembly protein PilP